MVVRVKGIYQKEKSEGGGERERGAAGMRWFGLKLELVT
jgi:hypothetical protein